MPPAPPPAATPDALARVLQTSDATPAREQRALVAAVACAHLVGLWALMQVDSVRAAVREVAPMMVDLVAPDAPPPQTPPPPPPPRPAVATPPVPQPPILAAPSPQPQPAEAFTAPPPVPAPAPVAEVLAPPTPPAPPQPPAPPPAPRKQVAATALRYLVEPPFEVPRLSRRAGEFGLVTLRVVVSARGEPVQVRLVRSSGFARLDEQALWAMRQARFQPHTENGQAIEVEALATADYPQ